MDISKIVRVARAHGWTVTRSKSQHWKFVSPDRRVQPVFSSGTPSDWRSCRNLRAELKRHGLPI